MPEHIDTVVIGAGQAGLAISYCLKQRKLDHIALEKQRIGEAWRSGKWDSFTLVSPNWTLRLPGFHYEGDDPDDYFTREQVIRYLDDYVRLFNPPVRTGVEVTGVREGANGLLVETKEDAFSANNVVIATGAFQKPRISAYASRIAPEIPNIAIPMTCHRARYWSSVAPNPVGRSPMSFASQAARCIYARAKPADYRAVIAGGRYSIG